MRVYGPQQQPTAAPSTSAKVEPAAPESKCACPELLPDALLGTSAAPRGPGKGKRSALFDLVKPRIFAEVDAGLGPTGRKPDDCPYLEYWLRHYEGQDEAHIERAIRTYTRSKATSKEELADAVAARVREAVATWVATGQVVGVPPEAEIQRATSGDAAAEGEAGPKETAPAVTAKAPSAGPRPVAQGPQLLAKPGSSGGASVDPTAVRDSLGTGAALDAGVRGRMETAFGASFDDVRVHTGNAAEAWSSKLSARAFTVGTDVAFGRGEYRPGTMTGDLLLAHELGHVTQQRGGAVSPQQSRDAALEREADMAAASAMGLVPDELERYPGAGRGLRLQRCDNTSAPPAITKVGDPTKSPTYEAWLRTFPGYSGTGDVNITSATPDDLKRLITGSAGLTPDCADVSILLHHYYLKANGKTFSFDAGPPRKTYTIGAGIDDKAVGKVLQDIGTINFQEDRKKYELVHWYTHKGVKLTNLKKLIDAGLKPGDLMVWKRLPALRGNFEGHVQTVRAVDLAGKTLTVVQGNMSAGVGIGVLQERQRTFAELTGKADGDAPILDAPEESFFGAGPWAG